LVPVTPTYDLDAITPKVVQGYVIYVVKKKITIKITQKQ